MCCLQQQKIILMHMIVTFFIAFGAFVFCFFFIPFIRSSFSFLNIYESYRWNAFVCFLPFFPRNKIVLLLVFPKMFISTKYKIMTMGDEDGS